MNGNAEDLDKWDINVKNNYVCTWNDHFCSSVFKVFSHWFEKSFVA